MSRRLLTMASAAAFMSCASYVVAVGAGSAQAARVSSQAPQPPAAAAAPSQSMPPRAVLEKYCITCHNQRIKTAGLTLDTMDIAAIADHAEVWEDVLLKVSTGVMPPAGRPRPDKAARDGFILWLESELDAASSSPSSHEINTSRPALSGRGRPAGGMTPVETFSRTFSHTSA